MFVRPTLMMDQAEWTAAHVEAFAFFGGVPARLVPDNLKTGVDQPGPLRPEDQPVVCRAGRALRHPGRPGPGAQAQGQAAGRAADALCAGLVLAGPGVHLARRRCGPPRWRWCTRGRRDAGRVARWTGAAPAAVFAAVERAGAAAVAGRAVRAGHLVERAGRPGHPRQGRRHALLGAVAATSATASTPGPRRPWCRSSTTGSWSRPTRARTAASRPTSATTRRRRSPSTCAPRPGAAAGPPRSARPAAAVIDELLADNALFRLRAAQGVLGLADKHDPGPARGGLREGHRRRGPVLPHHQGHPRRRHRDRPDRAPDRGRRGARAPARPRPAVRRPRPAIAPPTARTSCSPTSSPCPPRAARDATDPTTTTPAPGTATGLSSSEALS